MIVPRTNIIPVQGIMFHRQLMLGVASLQRTSASCKPAAHARVADLVLANALVVCKEKLSTRTPKSQNSSGMGNDMHSSQAHYL